MYAVVAAAFADPPAPPGWSAAASGCATVYRAGAAELRLHPLEPVTGPIEARFRRPDGVQLDGYGAPQVEGRVVTAMSGGERGGERVLVVALACSPAPGTARYAELLVPFGAAPVEAASAVVAEACAAPPMRADPTAEPAPVAVAPDAAPVQVHAVARSARVTDTIAGPEVRREWFLLLADGTARRGIPSVLPSAPDVDAERASAPTRWGTWEADPRGYVVRFGRGFEVEAEPVRPATVDRLDGWFVAPGDGGCGSRGVRFQPDRRFQVLGGPSGTYHMDGWSLELRTDRGRVTRGFFYMDLLGQVVWFEGEELAAAL